MAPSFYEIRQCENFACRLRYPLIEGHPFGERCPACLGATQMVLQRPLTQEAANKPGQTNSPNLEVLLDNVRSAWNVGAIFRTADAFGVQRVHLCGITPTPENTSVAKTALGADKTVAWTTSRNALTIAKTLKNSGVELWGLEQDERAISIYDLRFSNLRLPDVPIILIVGNEITGVDPALLDLCDKILYIPMRGEKRSLNVEVAFGVAVSQIKGGE